MISRTKRKYIDSHWLVFAIEGAVALLFGWFIMFNPQTDTTFLVATVGTMLLAFGLIELFNVLHREHMQDAWTFTLGAAVFEIAVALALLFTLQQDVVWHLGIIAVYSIVRGILELLIAARSIDDRTDRFIWLICGVCGIILGFVIFNSGHLPEGTFIKFFGSYLVILGLADLIYGIHNRDQQLEAKAARAALRKSHKSNNSRKSSPKHK